jgi:hypothetical protein
VVLEIAEFMKSNGLLEAGYTYITLGGMGFAEHGDPKVHTLYPITTLSFIHFILLHPTFLSFKVVPGWPHIPRQNITRNSSGHLQADPARFPGPGSSASCLAGGAELAECLRKNNYSSPEACGCKNGNEGMRIFAEKLRSLGFQFGIYSDAGEGACDGAHGTSELFEQQDVELFVGDWKAEYVMIDSCGITPQKPPLGPAPGATGGQGRWELTKWHNLLAAEQENGAKPVALHDCHVGCASTLGGPTLSLAECDSADQAQQWAFDTKGNHSSLVDQKRGLCIGCGGNPEGGCANTARVDKNGTGYGMQACLTGHTGQGGATLPAGYPQNGAIGAKQQIFNLSTNGTIRAIGGACLGMASGGNGQVVLGFGQNQFCDQGWQAKAVPSTNASASAKGTKQATEQATEQSTPAFVFEHIQSGKCLSADGPVILPVEDPWCISNNNMWRVNTDVLQVSHLVDSKNLSTAE